MTEAELTKKMVKALKGVGAFAVKIHGGPNQQRGLPDIVGCLNSCFFGIEVKRPGKEHTLTKLQDKKLQDIRDAGGFAFMSSDVDTCVRAVLRECGE